MSSIMPTIGRKVWCWEASISNCKDVAQAFDATVIFVRDPDHVDVQYTNHYGTSGTAQNMPLADYAGDTHGSSPTRCTWMPYQVKQAVKESLPVPQQQPYSDNPAS